jgi:hypothetical protein
MTKCISMLLFICISLLSMSCDNASTPAETEEVTTADWLNLGGSPEPMIANGMPIGSRNLSRLSISRISPVLLLRADTSSLAFDNSGTGNASFPSSREIQGVSVEVNNLVYSFVSSGLNFTGSFPNWFSYPSFLRGDSTSSIRFIALPDGRAGASFTVQGLALADNRIDVPGKITISAPLNQTSVSRASGLTITFQAQDAGRFLFVQLISFPPIDSLTGRPIRLIPKVIFRLLEPSATAVRFSPADLTDFPNGAINVVLHTSNMKLTNSRTVLLNANTTKTLKLQLTN